MLVDVELLLKQVYPDPPIDLTKQPEAYRFPDGSLNKRGKQMMEYEIETSIRQGIVCGHEWQKRYPNLAWLQKERLFIRNHGTQKMEIVLFCQRDDNQWGETIVNLDAQHKALLLFFLEKGDDGLLPGRYSLLQASKRILELYSEIRPLTETTHQLTKDKNEPNYNDWFHKLRTAFNEAAAPYRFSITNNDKRYVLKRSCEVFWDEIAYKSFLQEKEQRSAAIKKEESLWLAEDRHSQMQRIEAYKNLDLGAADLLKMIADISLSPLRFPIPRSWFINTIINRIIWCVEEKRVVIAWCTVDREVIRNSANIELPARELALLLLFASHLDDGIKLKELLPGGTQEEEYMQIYQKIGGLKKNPNLQSTIKKKPEQTIRSLMSSIKRKVTSIDFQQEEIDGPQKGLYYIKGPWRLIKI